MERLVHEARASVCITKRLYAIPDLLLVVGSRSTHDQAHRPDIVETDMRTADALAGLSLEEVRVGRAQHQATGILVNRVVHVHTTQERQSQQARYVSVVHENTAAVTIHLEGVYLTEFRMLHDSVFLHGLLYLTRQRLATVGQVRVISYDTKNLSHLAKRGDSEQVRWYQEAEQRSVVGRTERRDD